MAATLVLMLALIIASIAYARGYRSAHEAKSSKAGWYGLGMLGLLFAGLWASGGAGNEPAAYGFGIALVLALPIMLLVGVASAVGRALGKRRRKDKGQTQ